MFFSSLKINGLGKDSRLKFRIKSRILKVKSRNFRNAKLIIREEIYVRVSDEIDPKP